MPGKARILRMFIAMALLHAGLPAYGTQVAGGEIRFLGAVVTPTASLRVTREGLSAPGNDGERAQLLVHPLNDARASLASPLLDYFAGYVDEQAVMVTAEHY